MNIKVQYLGQIRVIANTREEELEIPTNAMVQELLFKLSGMYGKNFDGEVFTEDGVNVRDDLTVAINGTAIRQLDYLKTRLKQNDVVTLFPIFPGGG